MSYEMAWPFTFNNGTVVLYPKTPVNRGGGYFLGDDLVKVIVTSDIPPDMKYAGMYEDISHKHAFEFVEFYYWKLYGLYLPPKPYWFALWHYGPPKAIIPYLHRKFFEFFPPGGLESYIMSKQINWTEVLYPAMEFDCGPTQNQDWCVDIRKKTELGLQNLRKLNLAY